MPTDIKGKIIAIDFDATISKYDGFKGIGIFGEPITNAAWAIRKFREMGAIVVIHTCRREVNLIADYLTKHEIFFDYINFSPENKKQKLSDSKISADVYIDDKGVSFRGDWKNTYFEVVNFVNWYKK